MACIRAVVKPLSDLGLFVNDTRSRFIAANWNILFFYFYKVYTLWSSRMRWAWTVERPLQLDNPVHNNACAPFWSLVSWIRLMEHVNQLQSIFQYFFYYPYIDRCSVWQLLRKCYLRFRSQGRKATVNNVSAERYLLPSNVLSKIRVQGSFR